MKIIIFLHLTQLRYCLWLTIPLDNKNQKPDFVANYFARTSIQL